MRPTTAARPATVVRPATADLDIATVRAFVAVTEDRYFSEAASRLGISQQAISKRIAKLEADLGVRLFFRTRTGADLTEDGRAFLHHARALVGIADQALETLSGRRRSLRVDVLDTRLASVDVIRGFHQSVENLAIEITTSNGLRSARGALAHGSVDAALARVSGTLEEDLRYIPAYLEPLHVLVGRDHALADQRQVEIERLAGSTVWMPGNAPGSEWADYYTALGAAFDIRIDASGPDFGWDYFVEEISAGERIGLGVTERTRVPRHPSTVQIPIVDPVPVYPCALLWHRQNHHPVLGQLIEYVTKNFRPFDPRHEWLPEPDRAAFTAPPKSVHAPSPNQAR
ncbi:LysR family transcriptional regulator [Actinopolymorpha alba]|uniref:LysR family transcriptional regulator n=1 Tax=Actinopolymorpha alba TaxID=533267 RepID=UPI001ED99F5B|nr:LysR family transcriptional regulator [Actinopolymorpha alba]